MNMGHIYWCRGDRKTALEWYLKSVKHQEWSLKDFVQAFVEDRHILMKHGVNPDDIPIMLDQLRYYLVS